jgi:hypothetical protein
LAQVIDTRQIARQANVAESASIEG